LYDRLLEDIWLSLLVASLASKITDEIELKIGMEGNGRGEEFGNGHLIATELRRSR
jgi:hypothetical protein